MVKTTSPILGLSAAGTVGRALTFSSYKGRSYLKRKSIPRDPGTGAQLRSREILRFLSSNWRSLTNAQRASWNTLALRSRTSAQNAYLKHNTERFFRGCAPGKHYPVTETGDLPTLYNLQIDGYHNVRSLLRQMTTFVGQDTWAYMIWYSTDFSAPWTANARLWIHPWLGGSPETVFIPHIPPDTYYPWVTAFTGDGNMSAPAFNMFFIVHNA